MSPNTISASALGLSPLLKPVAALAGWTFIMETWMYATRMPAISKYNVDASSHDTFKRDQDKVPLSIRQIADNYNHLHEQPTVFYAIALSLALLGDNHKYTVGAAWGYVGIRIVHSLYQSLSNNILVRFGIFVPSSLLAAGLTARLAQLVY